MLIKLKYIINQHERNITSVDPVLSIFKNSIKQAQFIKINNNANRLLLYSYFI